MNLFHAALFVSTGKDRTSIAGRYISYRFVAGVFILAALVYLFIAPFVVSKLWPGYDIAKNYSYVDTCSVLATQIQEGAFNDVPDEFNQTILKTSAPPCAPAVPGGTLYCTNVGDKVVSPPGGSYDQGKVCPLLFDAANQSLGISGTPQFYVGQGEIILIMTGIIVVILIVARVIIVTIERMHIAKAPLAPASKIWWPDIDVSDYLTEVNGRPEIDYEKLKEKDPLLYGVVMRRVEEEKPKVNK